MKNLASFATQIFDLDDTLVNTRSAYFDAQRQTLENQLPHLSEHEIKAKSALLKWFCRQFSSAFPKSYFGAFWANEETDPAEWEDKTSHSVELYTKFYWQNLQPLPGIDQVLGKLQKEKKNLFLLSNGFFDLQRQKLEKTGLAAYFPPDQCQVSSCFEVDQKKPSPYMLDELCMRFNQKKEDCVFYGNHQMDILAGNLSGVHTVLIGDDKDLKREIPTIGRPNQVLPNWSEWILRNQA